MITLLIVKMDNQSKANAKMDSLLCDATSLGFVASGRKERYENGKYIVTCLVTPQRKDE